MLLLVPLYNTENWYFKGLKKWLGYITICGDPDEQFYSYGFDEEKSKVLCASMKQPLPNIFQGTPFKKHVPFLIDAKGSESSSKMFLFLPSITDRKEKINRWVNNVNLHPIDCLYDDFKNYTPQNSEIEKKGLHPEDLDLPAPLINLETRNCILNFMKHTAGLASNNLIRNANALMQGKDAKIDKEEFSWINNSLSQTESKFKLGYQF